jgi:hypothetical protein
MRYAFTLFFVLWATVLIAVALVKLAQGNMPEAAAVGGFGLFGIAMGIAAWMLIGRRQRVLEKERRPTDQLQTVMPKSGENTRPGTPLGEFALVRQVAVHLLKALAVWLGVVILASLAGIVCLSGASYALTTGLLRFGGVFWRCLLVALVAEALLFWSSHHGFIRDPPGPAWFSRVVATTFGAVPVIFGVLAAIALLNRSDPWEYLPGGPPFALRKFARQHPHLRIETVGFGGTTVAVTNRLSDPVIFFESELQGAKLLWEGCRDGSEPVRLGGPPPFPGSTCLARIQIRREDSDAVPEEDLDKGVTPPEILTQRYVYSAGGASTAEVTQHFLNWAKRAGHELHVYGDQEWMEVKTDGKTWTLSIRGDEGSADDVYVEYKEAHPPARPKNP